ncbi:DUF3592 domain-containing protein [Methanolobus sp.]|jgi:hypothetical protein|uniref:DUF3592 domain-containing protein n=1 Tax=Methanolobus sp. TaxID=1874737 RepID=UPI0025F66D75|nr:DUF3592 domain-containing protein [Methanolobus sp.]
MKKQRSFSLGRIFSNDYNSDLATSLTILSWFFYIFAILFGHLPSRQGLLVITELHLQYLLKIAIFITAFAIISLFRRLLFFHTLYKRGVEVTGNIYTILDCDFRHRVEYKYQYQNVDYWRGNALTRSTYNRSNFKNGDEVILVVDPQNPKWAVIRDIYF